MRIALDAMGGDFAPGINIEGCIGALQADPDLEVFLVGEQSVLDDLIEKSGYAGGRLKIIPSEGFVGMDEKPTEALRKKPNCSLVVCWKLMAGKEVDAVVSAGNTGAVVAAAAARLLERELRVRVDAGGKHRGDERQRFG